MKTAIIAWTLNIVLVFGLYQVLKPEPVETGYSQETIARMDDLIANITPLSVADLGVDAND